MQSNMIAIEGPIAGLSMSHLTAEKSSEISLLLLKALGCVEDDEDSAIDLVKRASTLFQSGERSSIDGQCPISGGLAGWQVSKLQTYISEHIDQGISLADLASVAKLSASYFSVAFKATFGLPPHAYVMKCRIETAQGQILNTNLPLCEIALNCGLADQAHLSRVFKRVTGMTPSAWRRFKTCKREVARSRRSDYMPFVAAA